MWRGWNEIAFLAGYFELASALNVLLYCFNFNISYFEPYTSTNIANNKDIFLVQKKKKMTYLPTHTKIDG